MRSAPDCTTMSELREAIDAVDRDIVALIAHRATYIDRAAQLKVAEAMPARVESRIEDVLAKVRAGAEGAHLDPDLIEALWRKLIEWSIAREETVLGPDAARDGFA